MTGRQYCSMTLYNIVVRSTIIEKEKEKKTKTYKSGNKTKKIELKKGRDIPETFSKDCETLRLK